MLYFLCLLCLFSLLSSCIPPTISSTCPEWSQALQSHKRCQPAMGCGVDLSSPASAKCDSRTMRCRGCLLLLERRYSRSSPSWWRKMRCVRGSVAGESRLSESRPALVVPNRYWGHRIGCAVCCYYPSGNSLHNYAQGICHIGERIYLNPSFLSRDFPEASGRLLRNHKEFTFQDMANWLERWLENQFSTLTNAYALCIDRWISDLMTPDSWYYWYVGIQTAYSIIVCQDEEIEDWLLVE